MTLRSLSAALSRLFLMAAGIHATIGFCLGTASPLGQLFCLRKFDPDQEVDAELSAELGLDFLAAAILLAMISGAFSLAAHFS